MMTVNEIMTTGPLTLAPSATLEDAGILMRDNRIRHIPIVGPENRLLGLITQKDLLAAASGDRSSYLVQDVMRRKPYTATEETDMRAAALTMQKHKIGSLPVVDNGRLIGIITDSDYVSLAINLLEQLDQSEPSEFDNFDDGDDF